MLNPNNKHPFVRSFCALNRAAVTLPLITSIISLNSTGAVNASEDSWGERDSNYQWRLCPATQSLPLRPKYSNPDSDPKEIEVRAESSRLTEGGLSHFSGEVEVIRGDRSIAAEVVTYDPKRKIFNAEGRTHIWDAGILWSGETATYDLENRVSLLSNGKFWNKNGMGRGRADKITNDRIAQKTELENIEYSTCPFEDEIWRLSASTLKLNHVTDRGSATHAFLYVKDTPVFYFPFVSFPISDERKSGFLSPGIGNSTESGFITQLPYYWNIAANKDATIAPRLMSKRGVLFDTELRYLGQNYEGETNFQILPDDDLKNGDTRSLISINHEHWAQGGKYYLKVDFDSVSDDEFFTDFGNSIATTSQRFLEQFVDLRYLSSRQSIYVQFRNYQSADETLPPEFGPYKQLPSIYYYLNGPGLGQVGNIGKLSFNLNGVFQNYERGNSLTGNIVSLRPRIEHNYIRPYLNIQTKFEIQHNQLFLDDPNRQFDDNESYTIPKLSIDGTLFSERTVRLGNSNFLQTLEPRLFYLLVPNQDFDHIPNFGTGLYDTTFQNIFRSNRFGGNARVGDANQVTAAITSRILDNQNGREKLRFNIGQIYHFRNRKVTLPGGSIDKENTSELLLETLANPWDMVTVRGRLRWDPDKGRAEQSGLSIRFQPNIDTVLNLKYRQRRGKSIFQPDIRQTDLSARIPIRDNLALIGRWNYSLEQNESIETFGGVEYESCCWGARLVARRFLKDSDGIHDNSIFMQIHFRGLGGFGRGGSESFISSGIAGYTDPFE